MGVESFTCMFQPQVSEPEQELEGALEGEEQPDHEGDLIELPQPSAPNLSWPQTLRTFVHCPGLTLETPRQLSGPFASLHRVKPLC